VLLVIYKLSALAILHFCYLGNFLLLSPGSCQHPVATSFHSKNLNSPHTLNSAPGISPSEHTTPPPIRYQTIVMGGRKRPANQDDNGNPPSKKSSVVHGPEHFSAGATNLEPTGSGNYPVQPPPPAPSMIHPIQQQLQQSYIQSMQTQIQQSMGGSSRSWGQSQYMGQFQTMRYGTYSGHSRITDYSQRVGQLHTVGSGMVGYSTTGGYVQNERHFAHMGSVQAPGDSTLAGFSQPVGDFDVPSSSFSRAPTTTPSTSTPSAAPPPSDVPSWSIRSESTSFSTAA